MGTRGERIASGLAVALVAAALALSPAGSVPAASAAPAGGSVDAGRLRATVRADPWRLSLTDGTRSVLDEVSSSSAGPTGTLGFSTSGGWFHATRVVSERREGSAYIATLATDDPLGRQLSVRLAPDAEGVIRLSATVSGGVGVADVTATGIAFDSRPGERFLGFGERSNAVDQRGGTVENYVAEGPYRPDERAAIAGFVPGPGFHPRDDATYFPMPWLLSTRGYGVLLDNDETSYFRLGSDRAAAWSVEAQATSLSLRVFAGPTPAEALRRLTQRLGRQPPAAAPFYFGPWFQPTKDEAASLRALQRADAPVSVAQTYTHYLPCGDQRKDPPFQRSRTTAFHAAGLAVTTYFNPMICTSYQPTYDRAKAAGAITRNSLGQPYEYRYTGSSVFLVGQFDFSAPSAVAFYGALLGEAVGDGYDGWMEDFGEYTPTDSRSADGTPGALMHNRYPVLYHGAARTFAQRAPRPLARFNRSGWTGAARVSQIVWGGDPSTDFGYDGLQSAVRNGLTMGLSGVSLWGSDIGGFFTLSAPQVTPELLSRWLEFGAVSGVMRTQANGFTLGSKGRRPQITDPDVLPIWRRYAKLRTALYPYLAGAESEYDRRGMPIMRQLALAYPDDPQATAQEDEFLFGPDLLAAPVISAGARTRRVYLPRGRWVDLWRSAAYRKSDGSLQLGSARALAGGREVTLPAPLDELPLLVRAGTVLPLLPPDVQTLSDYGTAPGIVHLRDRRTRMDLLAFPRGWSLSRLGPGEIAASREGRGSWTLEIRGKTTRSYRVQASLAGLRRPFRPCAIRVGSQPLSARSWSFDRRTGVLRATLRVRRARVLVSGCGRG